MRDFKGFAVEEDVSRTRKKVAELAKKVGLEEVDVDAVDELINSLKEELSTEDSVQLEKEHLEEEDEEEEEVTAKAEEVRTLRSLRLAEAFHLVEEDSASLDEDSPDSEEKKMNVSQTSLFSFFKKKESIKPPEPEPSSSSISKAKQLPLSEETSSPLASLPLSPAGSPDADDTLPL
jgi:hypothetical protein